MKGRKLLKKVIEENSLELKEIVRSNKVLRCIDFFLKPHLSTSVRNFKTERVVRRSKSHLEKEEWLTFK